MIEEVFYRRAHDNLRGVQRSLYVVFQTVLTHHQTLPTKRRSLMATAGAPRSAQGLQFRQYRQRPDIRCRIRYGKISL